MQNKLLKTFTLLLFVTLLAGFVAFRSGKLPLASDGNTINGDTLPPKDTTPAQRIIIPSSKSMVLSNEVLISRDSASEPAVADTALSRRIRMSSSKSGIVFTPPPAPDTSKQPPKKQQ